MTSVDPGVSPWAPLRSAVYRSLFFAQLASNIGTWMQTVGAQWFLVDRQSSPTVIALVQTASLAPTLLLALFAGTIADVFDRRRVLLFATAYSVVVSGVMTVLAWTHTLTPYGLLALTFATGIGAALAAPAWQAIQPELVPREQIPAASSLGSVTVNGARAIGPALAGVVVAAAGPGAVFAVNTASFLVVIGALVCWRRTPTQPTADRESLGGSIAAGIRYVNSAPIVRRIMLRSALFALPASALWALLPIASAEHLGLSAAGYGALLGVLGVGALAGVAAVPWLRATLSDNMVLALSALVFAAGTAAAGYLPLYPAVIALTLAGTAWIATLTTLNTAAQLSVAPWARARALSVYLLVFMGAQAGGSLLWGYLASHAGLGASLGVAAGLLVAVAASVLLVPLRAQTGTLDRATSSAWPTPRLMFEPEPDDGPVLVTVSYRVADDDVAQFTAAMRAVQKSRRRTGGYAWRLYRSGDDPQVMLEQFVVPSWGEFRRQHRQRWLASDHHAITAALAFTVDRQPQQRFYFQQLR
ncbi:MAG: MFS transporter [Mycobacterium sp.]|nr:MFS transporter [Mycobacterium sp.]